MSRLDFPRRDRPPRHSKADSGASNLQLQEFVRLYAEVDQDSRRILEQLVRRSSGKPGRLPKRQ